MIEKIPPISFFYVLLAVSLVGLVRGHLRYHDVENWPSVEAFDVTEVGTVTYHRTEGRTGSGSGSLDTRQARFRYVVDGVEFRGTRSTPDGGALPGVEAGPYRAYFNPARPDIAVLSPRPYRGLVWIVAGAFAGFVVVVHLICHFRAVF